MTRVWALLALLVLLAAPAVAQIPVVPGAYGSGMSTRAAYGSTTPSVYRVNTLADSGGSGLVGSLRYALEASGPRIVIFEISGNISLNTDINITNPYLTVAGQTAPDPGISIINGGIQVRTHDVLLQHLRIRPGWVDHCTDGVDLYPSGAANNVVLDHMSISWAQDENFALYPGIAGGDLNLTFWRSITAESLSFAGTASGTLCNPMNPQGEPGHGFLVTDFTTGVSMMQSLTAHNDQRNPLIQNGAAMTMLNNIVYDWYKEWGFAAESRNTLPAGAWHASVAGNRFIRGPNTVNAGDGNYANMFYYANDSGQTGNTIYRNDNTLANDPDNRIIVEDNGNSAYGYDPNVGSPPTQAPIPSGYSVMASSTVEAFVLPKVGARPANRDSVDTRLIAEVTARAGRVPYPANQSDVGGWPTLASNTRSLTLPSNPHVDSGNGYTNLEVWLHTYAAGVEGVGGPVDPGPATGTVVLSASFTGTSGTPLAASYVSDIGGTWALHAVAGNTGTLSIDNANRLLNASTDGGGTVTALTLSAALPLSAEYDLDWDWNVLTLISGTANSLWARVVSPPVSGTITGYSVVYSATTGLLKLVQVVSDTYTDLGSCAVTLAPSTTYHGSLRIRTAVKSLMFAGTQCTSSTDDTIPAAGKIGISAHASVSADSNTTGIHVDNVVVTDVTTTSVPGTATKLRLRFR